MTRTPLAGSRRHSGNRGLVAAAALVLGTGLSACTPDATGGTLDLTGLAQIASGTAATAVTGGGTSGSLPAPWNSYFVTGYDAVKLAAVRASRAFVHSAQSYSATVHDADGNASSANFTTNALRDARLDYAHSTGLTGAGQILGMIDSGVNIAHNQFQDKDIWADGNAPVAGDFHGTAVASVMLGNGADGQMTGFAPNAGLFAGYLDYGQNIDWDLLARYMRDATSLNAVAVNNSWGFATGTVADTNYSSIFGSGAGARFLGDVRTYAGTGVVVFAVQNDYSAANVDAMAGLPSHYTDLQPGWLAVVNAIPYTTSGQITGAERISAPCAEAAQYCLAANGQTVVADYTRDNGYEFASGASFATPQVTGSLALLAEAFPTLTPHQLRDRLLATANNSFYTATGSVTFAAGVTHGYNDEFGMGFLDLQQALLPIGQTAVPMANGATLVAGQPAIVTGTASGNAVAASLGPARVLSIDALGGQFTSSAAGLAARTAGADLAGMRLDRLDGLTSPEGMGFAGAVAEGAALDLVQHVDLMAPASAAQSFGAGESPIYASGAIRLAAITSGGGVSGLSASAAMPWGDGALGIGLTAFGMDGNVLGLTAPGYESRMQSSTAAVSLSLAQPLGAATSLRAQVEFGRGGGTAGGMISAISGLAYDRAGISLDRANALTQGDVLTLFARQPLAMTSGTARLDLPVAFSNGAVDFAPTDVQLSPAAREIDLGFEYAVPLSDAASMVLGASYQANSGNVGGQSGLAGAIGLVWRF